MRTHRIAALTACFLALSSCGEVRIGLTGADGDFLSYVVDVVSVRLEKSNGDSVQTLPHRHRVDFADLADVSESVTAATIPDGTHYRAVIRMDYTDGAVSVEVDGSPTPAEVVDARMLIQAWRREYNQERQKMSLAGLTPAQYAKQLATRPIAGIL